MKKKIFGGIAVLAIAALATWNVSLNSQNSSLSEIQLANIEALATESGTLFTRITGNCTYSGTGKAGSTVTIAGISITVSTDGTCSYSANNAEVRCIGGGNEVCIPQNCPTSP